MKYNKNGSIALLVLTSTVLLSCSMGSNTESSVSSASISSNNEISSLSSITSSEEGEKEIEEYSFEEIYSNDSFSLKAQEEHTIGISVDISSLRYFRIELDTEVNLLGTFTYKDAQNNPMTENFYISQEEKVFSQFIDAFRDPTNTTGGYFNDHYYEIGQAKKAKELIGISFKNVSKVDGQVSINKIEASSRVIETQTPTLYIQNDYYKLGASLLYGGALTYLERLPDEDYGTLQYVTKIKDGTTIGYVGMDAGSEAGATLRSSNVNLINCWDTGRLIQQSYYGSTIGYENVKYNQASWCYNPVQGGDTAQNRGQIVDYKLYSDKLYVKTRAMDWALNGYTTPSYMESLYQLSASDIIVTCSFVDWSGTDSNLKRDQEMPAMYLHYAFTNLVTYRGLSPWKNDDYKSFEPGNWVIGQGNRFTDARENWVAWLNDNNFGVGIYVPGVTDFLNGKNVYNSVTNIFVESCRPGAHGELTDDDSTYGSVCYTAPIVGNQMMSYEKKSYSYAMKVGYIWDIRDSFYTMHNEGTIANSDY